jgi:hypothetical protein
VHVTSADPVAEKVTGELHVPSGLSVTVEEAPRLAPLTVNVTAVEEALNGFVLVTMDGRILKTDTAVVEVWPLFDTFAVTVPAGIGPVGLLRRQVMLVASLAVTEHVKGIVAPPIMSGPSVGLPLSPCPVRVKLNELKALQHVTEVKVCV